MLMKIKSLVKTFFIKYLGIDIKLHNLPRNNFQLSVFQWCERNRVTGVIDAGANRGTFAQEVRNAGLMIPIWSFEPQPNTYEILQRASRDDASWKTFNIGLSETPGKLFLNVSENSVSSSFLDIHEQHTQNAQSSKYIGTVEVETQRLDSIPEILKYQNLFLKIDTQGYEMHVLKGAESIMSKISCIQLELSLTELYKGAPDYIQLLSYMKSIGFEIFSIEKGFAEELTGRTLQFDAFFIRSHLV